MQYTLPLCNPSANVKEEISCISLIYVISKFSISESNALFSRMYANKGMIAGNDINLNEGKM